MSAAQIENLIIQNSKGLPADVLQEILDFIQFLKLKKSGTIQDSVQTTLSEPDALETKLWQSFSETNFLKGYDTHEPEYTQAEIKEPNPEYKAWKGK